LTAEIGEHACRSCGSSDLHIFLRLGNMPLPDALIADLSEAEAEARYPLEVGFCSACSLVQILEEVAPEKLFVDNYLYFSSFSDELVARSAEYAAAQTARLGLDESSLVVEVASNDGYLLRHFGALGIPVLGVDPAPAQADAAEAAGVPTVREFFGTELAERLRREGRCADLLVANNVMAHTPNLNDFVAALGTILAEGGEATIENTYVRDLIDNCAFDTIYHEHFCYFSCTAVDALMRRHGLVLAGVEHLPSVQGGSLRWTVRREGPVDASVPAYLRVEDEAGVTSLDYYASFAQRVESVRLSLARLLRDLKDQGSTIAAYGAAAKGTILLNTVGIDGTIVDFVVDRNIHKHGLYMPGAHLPIYGPQRLCETRPDYLLVLAWNYKDEIMGQLKDYRRLGGRFIVPVPQPEII
jgi:SAM-dependent methyltransferase